jgi:hypothetical protein
MAAGRSGIQPTSRGAHNGQGAKVRREGLAPSPSLEVFAGLEEITGWLGTFRERLRLARLDGVGELRPAELT